MNPVLQKYGGTRNKQSAKAIANEYMKKDLSINQGSIDTAAPEKLKEMM